MFDGALRMSCEFGPLNGPGRGEGRSLWRGEAVFGGRMKFDGVVVPLARRTDVVPVVRGFVTSTSVAV